jgi:hypothetical protein
VNRLKSGPELKMPEWKVPPLLVDLYWDLRDRHLLPLVGLVIVAIVAAPFLLGGGSDESAPPGSTAAASSAASGSPASTLTVVEAKPGLREYSKRLDHRKPTDPFGQRYTSPPPSQSGPELGSETTGTSSSSSTPPSSGGSSETPSTSTPTSGSGSGSGSTPPAESPSSKGGAEAGDLTLFAFAIDVKIVRIEGGDGGSQSKSEASTRHRVMPTTPLPGEKAPVVTYMGVGQGAKNALLMVSGNVDSIFGDAKCLSGTDACQLLEVEPGMPETFVYGDDQVRYKVNVLKIEAVPTGHTEAGQQ